MPQDEAFQQAEQKIEQARRKNTTELNLSGMDLTELPESLGQLQNLQKLWLHNNPALGIPEEIHGKSAAEKLDYYFSTRGADGAPLRELKLIVVGRGGAGRGKRVSSGG